MREIPIKQAKAILKRALKGTANQRICLLTKKKDRSLTMAIGDEALALIEQGYIDDKKSYRLAGGEAKHAVTAAFKREFPRSHQVYLSQTKED
ncbi:MULTISPECIES: hypothetical protein [Limosilactobacillus]|uniref:Uncharacterized protein n=1 Tax=Limosilactobacillus panis DSM 6035 TaxID=1423782 RepID=A0A0R1XG37_9LACO|nr:hypothetical protein [Limosilactobacillus panis]KRM27147.1 hypothetical protein FD32_GL000107 [Limosilactobacillus panis DSM 6035]